MDDTLTEIQAFLRIDETAAEFLARTYAAPIFTSVPFIDGRMPLRQGNVIEVSGMTGSGKTELLIQLAVTFILPQELHNISLGGLQTNVIFYDLDCKFDIVRLLQLLRRRIATAFTNTGNPQPPTDTIESVIDTSLSRFHLIQCHNSFEFLTSLKTLPRLITQLTHPDEAGVGAILIDNIAAYYYTDRACRPPPSTSLNLNSSTSGDTYYSSMLSLQRVHAAMAAAINRLQRTHKLPILASKNALLAGKDAERLDCWEYKDIMSKSWRDIVTHRLILKSGLPVPNSAAAAAPMTEKIAKWTMPAINIVDRYVIQETGMHML